MKFLLTGDWHIDTNRPERRTDDYWETVVKKISFILNLAKKESCKAILQPGDFFNSHKANDYLKRWVIQRGYDFSIPIYTVFGQHDLRYHSSDVLNTPLSVLQAADVVGIIPRTGLVYPQDATQIYGASWYEDIPPIMEKLKGIRILITHRMIIKNEKLWDGQEDATMGNILLKTSGYDLIVSGDNHQHFTVSTKSGKHLVNCGSLLRTKIDQVDHHPTVYIYNTNDKTITPFEVPHVPFADVFDMTKYEDEKKRDKNLEAFVNRLSGEVELEGLDFIKNMDSFVKEQKDLDDVTLGIIEEVMA